MVNISRIICLLLCMVVYGALADEVPRFQVDPAWPKQLPNNWILGQIGGIKSGFTNLQPTARGSVQQADGGVGDVECKTWFHCMDLAYVPMARERCPRIRCLPTAGFCRREEKAPRIGDRNASYRGEVA